MAYLEVSAFKKIKAFFWALQKSGFNLNNIPARDNEGMPVDKAYCLNLLRSFPDFQGEEFKDDNFLIKYLSKPGNLKQILDQFTPAQQIELMTALEEKPIAVEAAGEQPTTQEGPLPTGEPAETMGTPGLPATSLVAGRRPRLIYNIPQTPETYKPEIFIANKSGVVTKAGDPSKLVKATRSGEIAEPGQPSKLVTANKSGVLKGLGEEAPTKQIFIADKSGLITGVRNITSPGWLKTFGSNAQIFVKKNLGRLGGGLGEIAKGVGRGIAGPALTSAYNLLGKTASRGLDVFERLSSPGLRSISKSFIPTGTKKLVLGLFGAFFFLVTGASLIGDLSGTTPSSQAAPVGGGPSYTGGGAGIVSCPLNDGRITCGSQNAGGSCNHCATNYAPYTCPAGGTTGRETAIDVVSSDRLVFLPFIGGGSVIWIIGEAGTPIDPAEGGGGIAIAATATTGEKTYVIRLVHIASTNLRVNDQIPSGTLIGQYISTASHAHITVSENGEFKPADTYFKLCKK